MAAIDNTITPYRVLIAEYLLANNSAAKSVAPSMLIEAEAMLMAVLTDIAALPNIQATVMLSTDSAQRLAGSGTRIFQLPDNVRVLCSDLNPQTLSEILHAQSADSVFDAVFLIAPECDGILVSLLKAVQTHDRSPIRSLNLDWQLAETFADKLGTAAWLQQRGIPTIPTRAIDDTTAATLRSATPGESKYRVVLKPRDGAGAESIQIVPLNREFKTLPKLYSDDDRWLLQPYMPGLACSVGFLGGGSEKPTIILPPARQQIVITNDRLSYHGGQIPCESAIADHIASVAQQLVAAIGPFSGYVGADLLVNLAVPENSPASVLVVEINPRLCTSYVGYRALAADNLATWLLQRNQTTTIRWNSQVITFSASGQITQYESTERQKELRL